MPVQDHLLEAMANYALTPPKQDHFISAERGPPGLWAQETAANNNKNPSLRACKMKSLFELACCQVGHTGVTR